MSTICRTSLDFQPPLYLLSLTSELSSVATITKTVVVQLVVIVLRFVLPSTNNRQTEPLFGKRRRLRAGCLFV